MVPGSNLRQLIAVTVPGAIHRPVLQKPPRCRTKELGRTDIGPFEIHNSNNSEVVFATDNQIGQAEIVADQLEFAMVVLRVDEVRCKTLKNLECQVLVLSVIWSNNRVWLTYQLLQVLCDDVLEVLGRRCEPLGSVS